MYTKGPWMLHDMEFATVVTVDKPGQFVALCDGQTLSHETAAANAKLIAAAPELLAALDPDTLEAIANEIDCFEHSARSHGLRSIAKEQRTAIAKATNGG